MGHSAIKKTVNNILKALSDKAKDIAFEVSFWDGVTERFGIGDPVFKLIFKTEKAAKHVIKSGSLGFGEEYMSGNIEVEGSIEKLFQLGADPYFQNLKLSFRTKLTILFQFLTTFNTLIKSKKNISHHYDLGNKFYKLWLDESMTYSCAYFHNVSDSLETAQDQKYEHICRKLMLKKDETLIDIGSGWGGMLIYAAKKYGIKGVGCTISKEQFEYSKNKAKEEGLENSITFLLEDYRNINGQFDKFVSIGMAEHVGKKYFPIFAKKIKSLLKPQGIGFLHTIGKERDTPVNPWLIKYIFPGSYIPSLDGITRCISNNNLAINDLENLRIHYAMTLDQWSKRFESNVETIKEMFDEKFVRMWRFYLQVSSAAFKYGNLRLYQLTFTNGLNNSLPLTREYIYEKL